MIPSVRHLKPTRDEMVDGAFAFALVALALWAFESAFGGTEFLVVGLIGAAVSIAVTHLCLRRELPVLVMACVWSAVFVVVGGALAARSQALFGVLPSPNTAIAAIRTSVQGWKQLLTTVPPVGRTGDLLVLPVFCGMLGAGAAYALARRASWTILAAAPAIAVMALGILCGTQSPVSVLLHGGVMALGIVSWGAVREHRERSESRCGHTWSPLDGTTGAAGPHGVRQIRRRDDREDPALAHSRNPVPHFAPSSPRLIGSGRRLLTRRRRE